MNTLEKARKDGKEVILEKIHKAKLQEHGIYKEAIDEKIKRIQKNSSCEGAAAAAIGAFNNQDTEHILLPLIKENPEKILYGLGILGFLLQTSNMVLYLPEGEKELKKELEIKAYELGLKVCLEEKLIDVREINDNCCNCHYETLIFLSEIVEETYIPGAYVLLKLVSKEETYGTKPIFVPFGTTGSQLAEQEKLHIDLNDVLAVQIGTNLFIPDVLEKPITENTELGNGVIIIYDQSCCIISKAEEQINQFRKVSCGKCTFCREGFNQLSMRLHDITTKKGDWNSLDTMKEIGEAMEFSSLCSVGQTGAKVLLDTMKYFGEEYETHIKKKQCKKESCLAFVNIYIHPSKCNGCGKCIPSCPVDCIEGLEGYIHMIEDLDCTKCEKCMEVCEENAIIKTVEKIPNIPNRLTHVGKFKRF